ncbi:N-formylglutamate amidohydrolase [Aliisedimentitalea scapharcae]|uniref:N-formylglutamate amidohydrolase n=1 Tax=Aliisedimentitalea scapharcae TaxID=1524259 RepID=A0ABZ2XT98_9RHOB
MTAAPVEVLNPDGTGRVVILCEHASRRIPQHYGDLGLKPSDRDSHAAWDPGARDLALALSRALDAPVVAATVSRLVYDCNRPPDAASAMPTKSELIQVPGNADLTQSDRDARTRAVYDPFCVAVNSVLDARGPDTIVVTVHSFTPTYFGQPRAVELGLLHDTDSRLVDTMLAHADRIPQRHVARNEPYGPADGVTHSLCLHALSRGLANVMLEVRNDLLRTPDEIADRAQEILMLLEPALTDIAVREDQT